MSTTTTAPHTTTDADVVVVGGGMGGLTVAHDLARAGLRVIVCEASDAVGGLLRRGRVGGIDLDLGAESFATRTDAVAMVTKILSNPRLTDEEALALAKDTVAAATRVLLGL